MEGNDPVAQIDQILGGQQQASVDPAVEQSSDDPNVQAINDILGGASTDPSVSASSPAVASARSQLGSQDDNGMCQRFAEEVAYGKSGIYPSAIDAWNDYTQKGKAFQDVSKAPAGSLVYFGADGSNGGYGHVGVSDGEGNIISATYNGVEESTIDDWVKNTGQVPLGYAQP